MLLTKSKIYEKRLFVFDLKELEFIFLSNLDFTDSLGLIRATEKNYRKMLCFFINNGVDDWNSGMAYASENGHEDLIDFFIYRGASWWFWPIEMANDMKIFSIREYIFILSCE